MNECPVHPRCFLRLLFLFGQQITLSKRDTPPPIPTDQKTFYMVYTQQSTGTPFIHANNQQNPKDRRIVDRSMASSGFYFAATGPLELQTAAKFRNFDQSKERTFRLEVSEIRVPHLSLLRCTAPPCYHCERYVYKSSRGDSGALGGTGGGFCCREISLPCRP